MSAPKGLQRPGAATTILSKKPILLLFTLVSIIIVLLLFSIFDDGKKNKGKGGREQEIVLIKLQESVTTDEKGLNLPQVPRQQKGIAKVEPGTEPTKLSREPIQVINPAPPDPNPKKEAVDKLNNKQIVAVLQYRFEKTRQALEANPVSYRKDASTTINTPASDRQRTGSSSRLNDLNNELARAKATLAMAGSQTGVSVETNTGLSISSGAAATSSGNNDMWNNGYFMDEHANALSIKTGAIIPALLITGINSTLPGSISGQVSQSVWDTATGYNLLIPQGTKLFGSYQNKVIMGQERLFVVWQRLIFPDGRTMTLNDMPGADQLGYSGLSDQVDNHYFKIYGHALLMSLVVGGSAYALNTLDSNNSEVTTLNESMGTAFADQMGQTTMGLLEKHMSIAPTLTIRPGYRLNIIVVKDLEFNEPYQGKL